MLHICCVNAGNYLGRGAEYVNKLYDAVLRNLPEWTVGEFVCFTDDTNASAYHENIVLRPLEPGLEGWWNKLALFRPGLFPKGERVVFFDLDTLIIGPLDDIVLYKGDFAMLRDFYRPDGFQSSVMLWRSGYGHHLWDEYQAAGRPTHDVGGDQSWIEKRTKPDTLQLAFPDAFASYKVSCTKYPPAKARVIVFHGHPRPHEVLDGWVPRAWKIGGIGSLTIIADCNVEQARLKHNIDYALSLGLPELVQEQNPIVTGDVCIVGGGPSLSHSIPKIKVMADRGAQIWALNNAAKYLIEADIRVDGQWILDARPLNAKFIVPQGRKFLASQCDKACFDAAGSDVTLYHEAHCDELISKRPVMLVGGGSTVAMKAMCGAFAMGYKAIHIFGLDSSYAGDAHHAYEQTENDGDPIIEVNAGDVPFRTTPWMARQVEDFVQLSHELAQNDCTIYVHCGGLLGHVAKSMQEEREKVGEIDGNLVCYDGLWRPSRDFHSVQHVKNELWKIDVLAKAMKYKRVCIQAGGHVGLFALRLADYFEYVTTLEPDPDHFECIRRNTSGEMRISEFRFALGDKPGTIHLSEKEANNTGSIGYDEKGTITADVHTIDEIVLFGSVDLIYLDIEGMEGLALKGATETIKRCRPIIVCENKGLDVEGSEGLIEKTMEMHRYVKVHRLMRDDVFVPVEDAPAFKVRLDEAIAAY
jgi:FkbM family methyltransferase